MEARNANLVLCALVKEAKRIDDPRYQFDMEEEDGVVVKCTINNAEVLDVPGVEYQLHPSETEENRLDSLEVIIKDNNKKFSEIFRQLPYGIIKKNATGIGATTLALTAKNNCVIVCPTRNLAYEKYCKGVTKTGEKQYLYVGSGIGDIKKVEDSHIRNYLKNNNIPYKKILVVADSLPRLMTFLPGLWIIGISWWMRLTATRRMVSIVLRWNWSSIISVKNFPSETVVWCRLPFVHSPTPDWLICPLST